VTGVETSAGHMACEYFVNAAGMWARQLGALAGVCVPNQAAAPRLRSAHLRLYPLPYPQPWP